MKIVALISGGKDSIYTLCTMLDKGYEVACLAHLAPPSLNTELNSYMYQSSGAEMIKYIAEALGRPLVSHTISGTPKNLSLEYESTENDEVEDLLTLLEKVKSLYPDIEGVCSGAIKSTYQKRRIEDVCQRLGLTSFAPLWDKEQKHLMNEMIDYGIDAVLVRVCSYGLQAKHLGKSIEELRPHLFMLEDKYKVHSCGEGGEFESITLDCPYFKKKIEIIKSEVVIEKEEATGEVTAHLYITDARCVDKPDKSI